MLPITLAFLLGDLYLQTCASLPSNKQLAMLAAVVIVTFLLAKQWRAFIVLVFALAGFIYTAWYSNQLLSWSLPKSLEGKSVVIIGTVKSLPTSTQWQSKFIFSMDQFTSEILERPVLIRLGWHEPKKIHVGDRLQLQARLSRIQGTQNPAGFDYEAWALQSGIRATGSVLPSNKNKILSHSPYNYSVNQIREHLRDKIQTNLPKSKTSHWLMALVIGERAGIPAEDWEVLRHTGTNHLMAIAGLHIGVISGLIHILFGYAWRRVPYLVLRIPVRIASAIVALVVALIYSALAGFAIPTQRACIMLTAFSVALLLRRKINAWESWSLAIFSVLIFNPLSVLSESFWLSFGTIALIIYGMSSRLAPAGYWWKWGRVQWVIGVGLMPLSVLFFQECSLVSFIVNSIAIPWISLLVLPFCFVSGFVLPISERLGALLLFIADKSLAVLWRALEWFSHLPISVLHFSIPNKVMFFVSMIGLLILLLPAGIPGRLLGVLWLLPMILYRPAVPANGEYWLTLLDVGQGLAVVVQTHSHLLIYDTGLKLGSGMDMGESVILPYLHTLKANHIDSMVISHGDNDHIGGSGAILRAMPVTYIYSSVPARISPRAFYCMTGISWEWDAVQFSFLHPTKEFLGRDNDGSCVLRVTNGSNATLLTGDIEKAAEEAMLSLHPQLLAAQILVAPHHGSKTSGLKAFVQAVHPQYVLFSTGYRNRYHFPHKSIETEYALINSIPLDTAKTGAIIFKVKKCGNVSAPDQQRIASKRYWYNF